MILLDPVNSITSVNFYRKVAAQRFGRSVLYFLYLALLSSLATAAAVKIKMGPLIGETFQWLESSVPPLTYANGRVSSTLTAPLTLRHPRIPEITAVIDTARTGPVTIQDMDEAKASIYLTATAFYVKEPKRSKLTVYDFSKAAPKTTSPRR